MIKSKFMFSVFTILVGMVLSGPIVAQGEEPAIQMDEDVFSESGKKNMHQKIGEASERIKESDNTMAARGSCHVSVSTEKYCFDGHTLKSCTNLGVQVNAVSAFHTNKKCPD